MEKFFFFRNGYGKVTCMVSRRVIFGTRITTQFCPAELSQRSYAGDGAMDGGGHIPVWAWHLCFDQGGTNLTNLEILLY